MEENKPINNETVEGMVNGEPESDPIMPTYDPDMEYYYQCSDTFYYDEKCMSCKYWRGYDCGAPDGPCNYESL